MSSTTLYAINAAGIPEEYATYKNSHGSAPAVWDILIARYIKGGRALGRDGGYSLSLARHWLHDPTVLDDLDSLVRMGDVPARDAVVFWTTLERAAIRVDDLPYVSARFVDFAKRWSPAMEGRVFHIAEQAVHLQSIYDERERSGWIGVCWCQTSLSDDPWAGEYDEDRDQRDPYNFITGTTHEWFDRSLFA